MDELTVPLILSVHGDIIAASGGDGRLISEAGLHRIVFGANIIADSVQRAGFIFYSLCAYPAFREGNCRTALAVAERVLEAGGYRITGDRSGILALANGIVAFSTEPEEVEYWFRENTRTLYP